MLAIAGIVYYSLSLRRISSWWVVGGSASKISQRWINRSDLPFPEGKAPTCRWAGRCISLRRKGMVSVSLVPSDMRFQEDSRAPKRLPEFTFKGNRTALKKPDRYLLGWLSHGTTVLNLEKISGPTKTERRNKATMGKYIKRMRSLKRDSAAGKSLWRLRIAKGSCTRNTRREKSSYLL